MWFIRFELNSIRSEIWIRYQTKSLRNLDSWRIFYIKDFGLVKNAILWNFVCCFYHRNFAKRMYRLCIFEKLLKKKEKKKEESHNNNNNNYLRNKPTIIFYLNSLSWCFIVINNNNVIYWTVKWKLHDHHILYVIMGS